MKKLLWLLIGLMGVAAANNRIIIKLKAQALTTSKTMDIKTLRILRAQPLSKKNLKLLELSAGVELQDIAPVATGARVLTLPPNLNPQEINQIIIKLKNNSNIEYVEPDRLLHINSTNSIPLANPKQWDMQESIISGNNVFYGDSFTTAFNQINRINPNFNLGQGIVAAVIDTGYVPHNNFIDNAGTMHLVLPSDSTIMYGYDFISNCQLRGSCPIGGSKTVASPSAGAIDSGDFLTQAELNANPDLFNGCDPQNSDWHGTHVTGDIIAQGYTTVGIIGGAYGAKVLPVRVLGKCGEGFTSDIVNGALWAAGESVNGVSATPQINASVLNLSLGGSGSCDSTMQDAINILKNNRVIMVVAAGNEALNVDHSTPANCNNVITVAALGPKANLDSYSNFGNVTINASGGDVTNFSNGIYSTIYSSSSIYPLIGESYSWGTLTGTSMATPHVVAAVVDLLSLNPKLNLTQIVSLLELGANKISPCLQGNCVLNGQLNVNNSLTFITESKPYLVPESIKYIYSSSNSSQTIVFTNNSPVVINIESAILYLPYANPDFTVTANQCDGATLAIAASCSINVRINTISSNYEPIANLILMDAKANMLGIANLAYSGPITPPTPTVNTSSSGGGCSLVDGDINDISLILLLAIISYQYLYRKIKIKKEFLANDKL